MNLSSQLEKYRRKEQKQQPWRQLLPIKTIVWLLYLSASSSSSERNGFVEFDSTGNHIRSIWMDIIRLLVRQFLPSSHLKFPTQTVLFLSLSIPISNFEFCLKLCIVLTSKLMGILGTNWTQCYRVELRFCGFEFDEALLLHDLQHLSLLQSRYSKTVLWKVRLWTGLFPFLYCDIFLWFSFWNVKMFNIWSGLILLHFFFFFVIGIW